MKMTQALMDRFLAGQCSAGEADEIIAFLSANPGLMDTYFSKAEWDAIAPDRGAVDKDALVILEKLQKELFPHGTPNEKPPIISHFSKRIIRYAAAAAVIGISMGIWWMTIPAKNNTQAMAPSLVKDSVYAKMVSPIVNWETKTNTHKTPMLVKLEDGSSATLYANTVIKYPRPFASNTRDITLEGDAFFEVAKNKLKPFIVRSGGLSTTALGTSFRITSSQQRQGNIRIALYTGKVVIKSIAQTPGWKQDVFLLPGQQLNYDYHTQLTVVTVQPSGGQVPEKMLETKAVNAGSNELAFDRAPLEQVFEAMEAIQHITIHFNKQDLRDMNFTGSISSADDAATMLKLIARMNSLRVMQEGNKYTIEKITKH